MVKQIADKVFIDNNKLIVLFNSKIIIKTIKNINAVDIKEINLTPDMLIRCKNYSWRSTFKNTLEKTYLNIQFIKNSKQLS